MNENFVVRLQMRNSVINPSPLDAIIHKFKTEELQGDYVRARAELPFARVDDVICSSFAILQDWQLGAPAVLIGSLRKKQVDEQYITQNTTDKSIAKEAIPQEQWNKEQLARFAEKGTIPYRTPKSTQVAWGDSEKGGVSVMNEYQTILTPYIYYCGITTDFAYLERCVKQMRFIGKGRFKGQGEIKEAVIERAGKLNGIVDSQGSPLRAIPIVRNIKVCDKPIVADSTYQPAYWDMHNHAKCFVPDFQKQWSLKQVEEALL